MSLRGWLVDRLLLKQPRVRRWLTRLLEGDRDTDVSLLHTPVHVNTIREHGYLRASRMIARSSFLNDEVSALLAIAGLLPEADAFVDVGANVGIYSKILHRFAAIHPDLRFYAFEADPDTARRLAVTLAGTKVELFAHAVGDRETELEFARGAVSHVSTRRDLATRYQLDETFKVRCRPLDAVGLVGRNLVLKIDVEGQELAVLQGAAGLFAAGRVRAVFLDGAADGAEVAAFLRRHGFDFYDARTLRPAADLPYALLALRRPFPAP